MKEILQFDEVSRIDMYEAMQAQRRGEPIPPPSGKPSENYTESEREAVKLQSARLQRYLKEQERVETALKTLSEDRQRDELIKEAVTTIQRAAVPTIIKIDKEEIAVGDSADTLEGVKSAIENELVQACKLGSPPWLPILWESMLESLEVKFKIGISIPPVDISVTLDAIKFVQLVSMRRAERI